MDKDKIMQKWINTPFAYTKFHHDLTLLQQDVMIRVSERLQPFVKEFYGSPLKNSKRVPKSLFTEALRKAGVMEFHISFSELGVAPNNYPAVKKAVDEVLDIKLDRLIMKDGIPTVQRFHIFNKSEIPLTDETSSVMFSLNTEIVSEEDDTVVSDYVFDMTQGYITHPLDIARISDFERMPMIYYLLRHESRDWKDKVIHLTTESIKEYLNMIKRDDHGSIESIAYPKFSKFREKVLIPAIKNINELHERGLIDVSVEMEFKYPGTRKTGNPEYIIFRIDNTKKPSTVVNIPVARTISTTLIPGAAKKRGRPRKNPLSSDAQQQTILFDENQYVEVFPDKNNEPVIQLIPGDRVGEWKQLVQEYGDGPFASLLQQAECQGTIDGAFYLVMPSYQQKEQMVAAAMDERLKSLLIKYSGRSFKTIQVTSR